MNDKSQNILFRFSNRSDLNLIKKNELKISYQNFFNQSQEFSALLSTRQIQKNDYVPILIEDPIEFIRAVISLWFIGAIPVPINTKLLDEEIIELLEDYKFKFLITDKPLSGRFLKLKLTIIFKGEFTPQSSDKNLFIGFNVNDEAVVIFTSGSTWRPKGVVHTFSSLINSIQNGNAVLNQSENSKWLASLPFYHIGGFQIICRSLFYGCTIVIPDSLKIEDISKAIVNHNPTHLSLVSTQLERLLNNKIQPNNSLNVSLIGGGFIDDYLIIEASKFGWKPYKVYGSSETASFITAINANEISQKPDSVGKPINNVEIKIADDSEVLIKSESLFKKYFDDEKETSLRLINGFYHSGDLGFIDNDSYLFIEARRNDLIVTGGENVNPVEVEKVLLQIDGIIEACVFPKPDKTWGQIVAAAIVCSDKSLDEKSIKSMIKQKLAGFKIPKQIYFTERLPRTILGKLERHKIKNMY